MIRTRAMVQEIGTKSKTKNKTGTGPASRNKPGIPDRAVQKARNHKARTGTADRINRTAVTGKNRLLMTAGKILKARTGTTDTLIRSRNRPLTSRANTVTRMPVAVVLV